MKQLLFFLSVFFINFIVFAQESIVNLTDKNKTIIIGKEVSYLQDKEGKLTIEQINTPEYQAKFIASDKPTLSFSPISDSYYWIRITVENKTTEKEWVLELASPLFEVADWYIQNNSNWELQKDGFLVPQEARSLQNRYPAIQIHITKNEQKTIYLKVKSNALACPITIENIKKYHSKHHTNDISYGAMQAILVLISIFCLYLYRGYKKLPYFIFSLFSSVSSFFLACYQGYWNVEFMRWFVGITQILIISYPIYLLKIPLTFPKVYTFFKFCIVYLFISYVISQILSNSIYNLLIQVNYIFIIFPFSVYLAIITWRNGNKDAIFYLVGVMSQFLFGIADLMIINSGIRQLSINLFHLGIFIEVLIFIYTLARQTVREQNELKIAKELAQKQMLEQVKENSRLIEEQNELLESKVKIRTYELNQTQKEILTQRDLLKEKNNLLEQYTNKIGKSIEAAQIIQQAILPPKAKMKELFEEYFVLFSPKDVVSGDFWWANEIDGEKYLIVADCTGHGVSGAMLTMIGSSLLDRIIRLLGITKPAEILTKLHEEIKTALQQEQIQNNEGMDIAITHWHYENDTCLLSFAAAKRPLYYCCDGKIEKIAGSRRNVGGKIDSMKFFENKTFTLSKGTCLYLCSDGYGDQNDVARNNFSEKRLINLLQQSQDLPMEQQKEILQIQLTEHTKGTEQRDDILVIGVRI